MEIPLLISILNQQATYVNEINQTQFVHSMTALKSCYMLTINSSVQKNNTSIHYFCNSQ